MVWSATPSCSSNATTVTRRSAASTTDASADIASAGTASEMPAALPMLDVRPPPDVIGRVAALPNDERARLVSKVVVARAQAARRRARLVIERRAEHERAEGQPVLARRHEAHLRRVFEALEADGCLFERERRRALGGGAGGRTVIAELRPVEQDRVDGGGEWRGGRRVDGVRARRARRRAAASSSCSAAGRRRRGRPCGRARS